MNECRKRGCSSIMGGAENKIKKENRGRALGLWNWVWAGLTHESWVGSGEVFKGCKTLFFSFFPYLSLSSLLWEQTLSPLSSLLHLLRRGEWRSETSPTRRLAVAPNVFSKNFFRSFSSTPSPLYFSWPKTPKYQQCEPRSKRKEKGKKSYTSRCLYVVVSETVDLW